MSNQTEHIDDRQASLKLSLPESVAVIGVGGVGHWVAYLLAMAGVKEIWLFDSGEVSMNNLNRLPFTKKAVNKKKVRFTAEAIAQIRPDCKVLQMGNFYPELANDYGFDEKLSWVVSATDTLLSRQQIKKWADQKSINYVEAAAEGEYGSATGEPATFKTPNEDLPGYQSVPVHVLPCVLAASIAVDYVIHNKQMGEEAVRLGWDVKFGSFSTYGVNRKASHA